MVKIVEVKVEKEVVDLEGVFGFVWRFWAKIQNRNCSKVGQILPEVMMNEVRPEVEVEMEVEVEVGRVWW